ncbi:hypothetical protein BXY75_2568 [Ulvibacter antarcticus]|uniref:Uncharacterized protein n=1 Tax=Ulvibacter antarcticus TaxID=442714 RepID=A0A3L9YAK7_9FLAO|nr:hypothetical protein BXY75_2568 [Ulvibacter antarcticus]
MKGKLLFTDLQEDINLSKKKARFPKWKTGFKKFKFTLFFCDSFSYRIIIRIDSCKIYCTVKSRQVNRSNVV